MPADWIREVLESGGVVDDDAFDRLYPDDVRRRSQVFWTPVAVARTAAAWLAPDAGARVLDVGAGCGKLCCVGALVAPAATWHGIERDARLVGAAAHAASRLGVAHQTRFSPGDALALDWTAFDGIYLFNPFEAALFEAANDDSLAWSAHWLLYSREIARVEQLLAEMPTGTRVVTYYGFGGDMPDSYRASRGEPAREDSLTLWIKQPPRRRARAS